MTDERLDAEVPAQEELLLAMRENPTVFGFFQAMRLLQGLFPERDAVGGFGDPKAEVVRLGVNTDVSFPASEIHELDFREDAPHEMTVNFMGLTGPQGVLPLYYSTLVQERVRERDTALKAFLDLFHHRIISLFYRAWEKSHFVAGFEKNRRDKLTQHLLDVVGLGGEAVQGRLPVRDESLLFFSGLLGSQQRGAVALKQLVEDYFGIPAEVEQFIGGWHPVPVSEQCSVDDDGMGPSSRLGIGCVVGDELWDPQSRVRLRLGPLTRSQFDEFLPTGRGHRELQTLTRFFGDDQFDFEVRLILAKDEVPGLVLGKDAKDAPLGWCTWIRSAPLERDADQTTLSL